MSEAFTLVADYGRAMPSLAAAALTLLGGWVLAYLGRILLRKSLKALRFESFSARAGLAEFLRKGGARYTAVELAGVLAYWLILAATFIRISKILDLAIVSELSEQFRVILPSAIAAIFIVIAGVVIVTFLATFAMTLARNAALPNAQLLSTAIKYLGLGIVVAVALDQVGFGRTILGPMILMLFGAVVFGVALAFGLGCKDLARNAMEQFLRELRERDQGAKGTDLEG